MAICQGYCGVNECIHQATVVFLGSGYLVQSYGELVQFFTPRTHPRNSFERYAVESGYYIRKFPIGLLYAAQQSTIWLGIINPLLIQRTLP